MAGTIWCCLRQQSGSEIQPLYSLGLTKRGLIARVCSTPSAPAVATPRLAATSLQIARSASRLVSMYRAGTKGRNTSSAERYTNGELASSARGERDAANARNAARAEKERRGGGGVAAGRSRRRFSVRGEQG